MQRDDISHLYQQLGQGTYSYLDFQTEDNFHKRIDRVLLRRTQAKLAGIVTDHIAPVARSSKVVAVISIGQMPGKKLVSGLAWMAAKRYKRPVRVVDLFASDSVHEDTSFLVEDGIKHILLNTSDQVVRMELAKDINWLGNEITADDDDGLIFVDVPERVMHIRHQAIAMADMLLILIPATVAVVRAIEDIESEIHEILSADVQSKVGYLLISSDGSENLSPLLFDELVSHQDLFVSFSLHKESIPNVQTLSNIGSSNSVEYKNLDGILSFIARKLDL
ncbi:MAG: hypothetical protein PHI11_05910 [Gallionella sp.]|nr:hypothetical protein [Gallionella sp.]